MADTAWVLIHYGSVGEGKHRRLAWLSLARHNGHRPIRQAFWRLNPGASVGLLDQMMSHQPEALMKESVAFADIADEVRQWLEDAQLIALHEREAGHLLRSHFQEAGLKWRGRIQPLAPFLEAAGMEAGELSRPNLRTLSRANGLPVPEGREEEVAPSMLLHLWQEAHQRLRGEKMQQVGQALKRLHSLPSQVDHRALHHLPNRCGVYYLMDEQRRVLYIGKSNRIHDRVRSHLTNDRPDSAGYHLRRQVHTFQHTETGGALVALILESEEIKRWMPPFNRAQRRKKRRYALHFLEGDNCYEIALRHPKRPPLREFASRQSALHFLQRRLEQLEQDPGDVHVDAINRVYPGDSIAPWAWPPDPLVHEPAFPWDDFFVLGPGRTPEERSLVMVKDQAYVGFGFAEAETLEAQPPMHWRLFVRSRRNDEDVRHIIRQWLRQHGEDELVVVAEDGNVTSQ